MKRSTQAFFMVLCLSAGGAALPPTVASAAVIDIDIAPPAPRIEVAPAPRVGYVWAPGFWDYRGREHVWVPGRYVRERRGYHWVPDGWVQRGPHWHREPGHWEH